MGEKMSLAGDLRIVSQDFHSAVALSGASAGVAGQVLKTGKGGQNGALCVIAKAHTSASIAVAKALTVTVKDGDTDTSLEAKSTFSVTGAKSWAEGELVWDYVLPPSVKEYVGVIVACDDSSAVGSLDVYLKYLPR